MERIRWSRSREDVPTHTHPRFNTGSVFNHARSADHRNNICVIWFRSSIPTRDLPIIFLSYPISISAVRQSKSNTTWEVSQGPATPWWRPSPCAVLAFARSSQLNDRDVCFARSDSRYLVIPDI